MKAHKNIEDRIKTIMRHNKRFYTRPTAIATLAILTLAVLIVPTTIALTQKQTSPDDIVASDMDYKPISTGIIQHVITKFSPVIPSGRIREIDGNSTKTIQSIIDSARTGDKILVKRGIYKESLTLKNGIILQGEDCNSVIIQGDMRVGPVLKLDGCDNAQVGHLTLQHYNTEILGDESKGNWPVIQINNSGAWLEHVVVCNSASEGIKITNDSIHLNHVLITECTIHDNRSYGILVTGNGNS